MIPVVQLVTISLVQHKDLTLPGSMLDFAIIILSIQGHVNRGNKRPFSPVSCKTTNLPRSQAVTMTSMSKASKVGRLLKNNAIIGHPPSSATSVEAIVS